MMSGQFGDYNIDICLVIDKTGSMKPIINTVKENALNLYDDIKESLEEKGKHVNRMRIRVIWFGDYKADKEDAMFISDFLTLPDEKDRFESFVKSVTAKGGGDIPEDGLEALAYAIASDWCTDGWKRRHIIALFTDAEAHEMGFNKREKYYPSGMPGDFGELSALWGDEDDPGKMDFNAKRLLLFAPDQTYWHTIENAWENVVRRDVEEANGLQDVTYDAMLNCIVNSI